ncbi:MAG: WD40/YVTN/BNR-like repeat-containing protein, partial [Pirellulaceae bacterium]
SARIMASHDRGDTWHILQTPVRSGPASGIFSIVFVNSENGVALGGTYDNPQDSSAGACISDDGGQTWRLPATPPRGYRSCVAIRPTGDGPELVAVSRAGTDVSRDLGNTWHPLDDEVFYAVDFSGDGKQGVAVGPDGRIGVWQRLP